MKEEKKRAATSFRRIARRRDTESGQGEGKKRALNNIEGEERKKKKKPDALILKHEFYV